MKKETEILAEVCEALKDLRVMFWRSNNIPVFGRGNDKKMHFRSMPKYSRKGVPDVIAVLNGLFVGIEVKKPGAKLRPDQITFAKDCVFNEHGYYFVVHSAEQAQEAIGRVLNHVDPKRTFNSFVEPHI